MKNVSKKYALNCYKDIIKAQGEHTGRWENEYIHEDSSIRYFEEMVDMANMLELNFSDNPDDYLDDYGEEDIYIKEDIAGFELFMKLENILRNIILKE